MLEPDRADRVLILDLWQYINNEKLFDLDWKKLRKRVSAVRRRHERLEDKS